VVFLEALPIDISTAFGPLDQLLTATDPDIIKFHCEGIKDGMEDHFLSGWFALFVRAVFRYTYEGDEKYNVLLRAVRRVNEASVEALIQFRSGAIAQYGDVLITLEELRRQQLHLMNASFYPGSDGKTIFEQDSELTAKIVVLEELKKPMLALFLIVEKIIKIGQESKFVDSEIEAFAKQEIIQAPIAFIAKLIPILTLLQKGEEKDLEEAIRLILQLISIEDPNQASSIQKEIIERGWLEIAQYAPKEQEEQEEGQTSGCCSGLARAASHLFFRRGNRVTPEASLQEVDVGDNVPDSPDDLGFPPDEVVPPPHRGKQRRGDVDILEAIVEEDEPLETLVMN
jgi:hypothetical protein